MINIMLAGNYKVFDGMIIASLSIAKHCKEPITAYILTMDLTEENVDYKPINENHVACLKNIFKRVNQESDVKLLDITDMYKKEFANCPQVESNYTPYTFLRLFADQIEGLPDKILYLDTDVVANGNIKELFDIDISDYEIAGVRDYYGKIFFNPRYINAGVILFNMVNLRQTKMLNKAMHLCATKKIFLNDQTAINKLTKRKKIIARKFNEQKKLKRNTVIRHFSMTLKFFPIFRKQNIKPWHIDKLHNVLKTYEFDDILNEYLKIKKEFENTNK